MNSGSSFVFQVAQLYVHKTTKTTKSVVYQLALARLVSGQYAFWPLSTFLVRCLSLDRLRLHHHPLSAGMTRTHNPSETAEGPLYVMGAGLNIVVG